jgi:hypothetical protein
LQELQNKNGIVSEPAVFQRRQETGDRRQETGDRRQETGDRRQETGDRRQETGDRRQETGDSFLAGHLIASFYAGNLISRNLCFDVLSLRSLCEFSTNFYSWLCFPGPDSRWNLANSARLIFPRWLKGSVATIWNSRGTCQLLRPSRQWLSSCCRETASEATT